jgi:hypothetical protein
MNRSSIPLGLQTLKKYWENEVLTCNLSFQRHAGMWNAITKSSLVASLLSDSYIPPILFLKDITGTDDKGKDIITYSILDGQQRLTTLFAYMNDEFPLHASTECVEMDGFIYDIAGKRFTELEEELQDQIKGFRFNIQCLENYTYDEVERLFYNINSGVALSTIQKAKPKLGNENMEFFNDLLSGSFFTQAINITENQAKKEDDLLLLLQSMLLLDNQQENLEYKNISTTTCLNYAGSIRNTYNADKKEKLAELIGYLNSAFGTRCKFLRKNNVPIVSVIASIAKNENVEPEAFKAFVDSFSNALYPAYEDASGSGNVKAYKVQQRLRVMFLKFCDYFNFATEDIQAPFSEEIPVFLEQEEEIMTPPVECEGEESA